MQARTKKWRGCRADLTVLGGRIYWIWWLRVGSEGNGKATENDFWVAFLVPFLGLWVLGEVCFRVVVRKVWLGGGFANGDVQ